jgi:hypothetical protein
MGLVKRVDKEMMEGWVGRLRRARTSLPNHRFTSFFVDG